MFRWVVLLVVVAGCAQERDFKPVIANYRRVAKQQLAGTYVYLRSLSKVEYSAPNAFYAPGFYLESDKLVQFDIREASLDIVSVDPLYQEESSAPKNRVLASFPIRHVDLLRKQNVDGRDTHEEEETETRRIWNEREFIIVDLSRNPVDPLTNVTLAAPLSGIEIDPTRGSIQFTIQKRLADETLLTERSSFLRFLPSATYQQREYPKPLQSQFGFFKTTTYQFDKYGRMVEPLRRDYIDRWDLQRPITYYYSANFPTRLKPMVASVFEKWNATLKTIAGREVLELKENTGKEEIGDLRYNLLVYDDSASEHPLLGYGPSVTNPRTGEILKGDVIVYGGTLRRAVYKERRWRRLLGEVNPEPRVLPPGRLSDWIDGGGFERMRPPALPLLQTFQSWFGSGQSLVDNAREAFSQRNAQRQTLLPDLLLDTIQKAQAELSDDELEIQIFAPLLTHELGHTLGLRHNFMGSVDKPHFASTTHPSSSVMDYGFFASLEPVSPAPYDVAALRIAYGESPTPPENARYYYCTDEDLLDSRNSLCNQFDAGTTLSEIVKNQMRRYVASYFQNNLRLDLVHFGSVDRPHLSRLLQYLLPFRLAIDHASSAIRIGKTLQTEPSDPKELLKLWSLWRARIEADSRSTRTQTISISPHPTIRIDLDRIREALADAKTARELALGYLAQIIKDSERPEFDVRDPVQNELLTRGVIYDKLLAATLVGARLSEPLNESTGVTLFEEMPQAAVPLVSSILSNTETINELGSAFQRFKFYDSTLRESVFRTVQDYIQSVSLESGLLKELFHFEKVLPEDRDREKIAALDKLNAKIREALVELSQSPTPDRRGELEKEIGQSRKEITKANLNVLNARDGLRLKAPIRLVDFGNLETASGRELLTNIGTMEEELHVRRTKPAPDRIWLLTRYLEAERSFAERWYRLYTPN